MPAYRLTLTAVDHRAQDMADSLIFADSVLGAMVTGLSEGEAEALGHDHFVAVGTAQLILRFAAASDEHAEAAAAAAISNARHLGPVDNTSLARRRQRYTPLGV